MIILKFQINFSVWQRTQRSYLCFCLCRLCLWVSHSWCYWLSFHKCEPQFKTEIVFCHLLCSTKGDVCRKITLFLLYIFILVKIGTFQKIVWVGRDLKNYLFPTYLPFGVGSFANILSLMKKCLKVLEKEGEKRTIQAPGPNPASCLAHF